MARLRGTGLGAGMALGTAAVVRMQNGVPLIPEAPPRIAALAAQRRLTETPEVVIVAQHYRVAQAIAPSIRWAKVVGIAVEFEDPDAAVPSVPAVMGLSGLVRAADDDVLVLVDATRGVVLVDPDPIYLAQYTAEHDRIAPKNRLYLDDAHLPAQTLDGHTLTVVAITADSGVETALASGPDALYHSLPLTFDPDELRRHLGGMVSVAAGKPLIVPYNPSLPLTPLVEAAASSDITIAVPPSSGEFIAEAQAINQLQEELDAAQNECVEKDILCGPPRIAAEVVVSQLSDWPDPETVTSSLEQAAGAFASRLIYFGPAGNREELEPLLHLSAKASANLMQVIVAVTSDSLPEIASNTDFASRLQLLIGAGITGFLVTSDLTQQTKEAIRSASVSECRESLSRWLGTA